MTTASFTYPQQHFIDTEPFALRYAVLTQAVLAYLAAGQLGRMLKTTQTILRLVRVFARVDAHNILLRRKLAMLANRAWRERVLSDLGGMRKLELWEAAQQRSAAQIRPNPTNNEDVTQPWLYTPERIAESERLKAHARKCMRACVHPNIVRDRVKVDFDGLFRLAPIPKGAARTRLEKVYTQNSIVDYRWNPIPFAKDKSFGPASVWPAEFYAAIEIEARSDHNRASRTIITERRSRQTSDIKTSNGKISDIKEDVRDERNHKMVIPLHIALPRATYRTIFENPV